MRGSWAACGTTWAAYAIRSTAGCPSAASRTLRWGASTKRRQTWPCRPRHHRDRFTPSTWPRFAYSARSHRLGGVLCRASSCMGRPRDGALEQYGEDIHPLPRKKPRLRTDHSPCHPRGRRTVVRREHNCNHAFVHGGGLRVISTALVLGSPHRVCVCVLGQVCVQ
jgi:hypothetical protein